MSASTGIESMPLYTHVDRIERGLASLGIRPGEPVRTEQLFRFDQWHYHGTDAIEAAGRALGLGSESRVLDVGAGIGGPARFLAHTFGCHVTALELQPHLHVVGADLTRRSGLAERIAHVCGDALTVPLASHAFDAVISFLAVLHIADRPALFRRLADFLRSGGRCYIEDLCQRTPFAPAELQELRGIVHGQTVTSIDNYASDLSRAGFLDVAATDLTSDWAPYANERLAAWRANHGAYAAVHGEPAYAAQELFYTVIARLYAGGGLGGVRLMARRP
jgi:cyclopropane fatty-acyl-phospholipid synthase-like methyltransferase